MSNEISQTQKDRYYIFCHIWNLGAGEIMKVEEKLLGRGENHGEEGRNDHMGRGELIPPKYIVCVYENAIMKPIILYN
jgi:hypothetical protein